MDPFKKRGERKREELLEKLGQYPYSFQMKDMKQVKTKTFQNLKNHLEAGLKAGYSTSLQTATTRNFLAFVLFNLGDCSEAQKETEKVLKMNDQRQNIVSLANKAYMLTKCNTFDDAEDIVEELENLKATSEFDYFLVKAKAELAACYMRLGPMFKKYAIETFKEVLPQAKEPEVWMWKFSLAMTYRHALDLQHNPYVSHGAYTVTHKDALDLLQEVIDWKPTAGEEVACQNLKANAYAEMGLLLHLTWDKTTEYKLCSQPQIGPLESCKKGLNLDDNDASVLCKAGRLFRYKKDLPKSKELLEKAVRLQPSSAGYHHLALTYKAMATNQQHGKKKTRRGGKREQRRKRAMAYNMKHLKVEGCSPFPADLCKKHLSQHMTLGTYGSHMLPPVIPSQGACQTNIHPRCYAVGDGSRSSASQTVERLKKVVKSPIDATHFDRNDPNVQRAFEYLKKAVEFSKGENSRAVYDLALLYKATEDVERALDLFETIAQRQTNETGSPSGLLEQVTSLEQMGLIYKHMADEEAEERRKTTLTRKSKRKLYDALSLASDLYSKTSEMKRVFGEVFQSPSALMTAAEASNCSDDQKMEKSRIFSLVNNLRESLALLDDIPKENRGADYYKLKIEVYARNGEYGEAVALLDYLKFTELYGRVIELLDCEDGACSLFNIYLETGKAALSDGPCKATYFADAFRNSVKLSDDDFTNAQAASGIARSSSQAVSEDPWDVMLLHDEEDDDIEKKADRLGDRLKTVCGLNVVRRSENVSLGRNEFFEILRNIEHSRVVVVLPGKEERTPKFQEIVRVAAESKSTTVVLLTEGIGDDVIPKELRRHRHMTCPAELYTDDISTAGPYTELIRPIDRLFKFLTNKE